MEIDAGGNTASLRDILITCTCKKRATMENAFAKTAMRGVTKCTGRRPWLSDTEEGCDQLPRSLQRGASNVWFSVTHSAISIPPWSEGAFKVLNKHWEMLVHIPDDQLHPLLTGMQLGQGTPYTTQDLVIAVQQRRAGQTQSPESEETFRLDEYQALLKGRPEDSKDQDFVCVPGETMPDGIVGLIERVMLVKRLREVRVLETFTRINPPTGDPSAPKPPLASVDPGWLPGIEVNGEGVFFQLNDATLTGWEQRPEVLARVKRIDDNYRKRFESFNAPPDRVVAPRLVLIHTLAHALITQWALDSGYPASALRERLYVSDEMCGFLIYTATSDSAGSLGGVVAQAEADRLESGLRDAIDRSAWCSTDPLCLESGPSGVDGLNLAACHACALLPEVSCEERNLLLDRALLVGTPEDPTIAFVHTTET
jgi:hypothetical protein